MSAGGAATSTSGAAISVAAKTRTVADHFIHASSVAKECSWGIATSCAINAWPEDTTEANDMSWRLKLLDGRMASSLNICLRVRRYDSAPTLVLSALIFGNRLCFKLQHASSDARSPQAYLLPLALAPASRG